jgi:hypothetical protein
MSERKQEKIGWVGGWLGGFIWVVILSVVLLFQGHNLEAGIGLLIAGISSAAILLFAPWRHPQTPYRRLMLPIYLLIMAAVGWAVWSWGGWREMGVTSWWSALILLPVLLPFWTVGNRRWEDVDQDQSETHEHE